MLGIDIKSLSSEKALACLYDRSEYIAFHLPVFLCRNEHEKERYLAEQADLLAGIEAWLLESLKSSIYMGIDYSEETQIYIFRKNDFFKEFVLKTGGPAVWLYPELSEDLCFLDKNWKCFLKTISHEEQCCLYLL